MPMPMSPTCATTCFRAWRASWPTTDIAVSISCGCRAVTRCNSSRWSGSVPARQELTLKSQRNLLPSVLGIESYKTSGIDLVRIVVNYARSHQLSFGQVTAQPEGNHHPFIAPVGIFPALDGAVSIAAPSDEAFRTLCTSLDARSRHSLKANGRTVTD